MLLEPAFEPLRDPPVPVAEESHRRRDEEGPDDRRVEGGTSFEREFTGKADLVAAKAAIHPLVITHPDSGRKALFVNRGYTAQIVGLSRSESDALLAFLFQHSTAPELVYRHAWQPRDLLIWDNRCTAHYAIPDYKEIGDRYLHRTSVKGDRPMQ